MEEEGEEDRVDGSEVSRWWHGLGVEAETVMPTSRQEMLGRKRGENEKARPEHDLPLKRLERVRR